MPDVSSLPLVFCFLSLKDWVRVRQVHSLWFKASKHKMVTHAILQSLVSSKHKLPSEFTFSRLLQEWSSLTARGAWICFEPKDILHCLEDSGPQHIDFEMERYTHFLPLICRFQKTIVRNCIILEFQLPAHIQLQSFCHLVDMSVRAPASFYLQAKRSYSRTATGNVRVEWTICNPWNTSCFDLIECTLSIADKKSHHESRLLARQIARPYCTVFRDAWNKLDCDEWCSGMFTYHFSGKGLRERKEYDLISEFIGLDVRSLCIELESQQTYPVSLMNMVRVSNASWFVLDFGEQGLCLKDLHARRTHRKGCSEQKQ